MNLTIDQGNSSAKVSVFDGDDIVAVARFDLLSISALARIIKAYDVKAAAYSSVRRPDGRIIDLLCAWQKCAYRGRGYGCNA